MFNIQVGTCITVAIADGSKTEGALAEVLYNDAWMHDRMSRKAKLAWMLEGETAGTLPNGVAVVRGVLDDMRPLPFFNGDLVSLADTFAYTRGGMQTKRDDFVYDASKEVLSKRISGFVSGTDEAAAKAFKDTGENKWPDAKAVPFSENLIIKAAYRPLDTRFLYNHRSYGAYLRWDMQDLWGASNFALHAMPNGTGEGPAVWCHGFMPDYHAFRGSYGGYVFPLYDRRPGHGPFNIKPDMVAALEDAYGSAVDPQDVFDVILCLLSATSYTTRFAEDLEDVFPHIPFPASREVFDAAAKIGADIRAVEAFERAPGAAWLKGRALAATAPSGKLGTITYEGGAITLCADGSGKITGIPQEVWDFSVSGYYVLRRWLAAREGIEIGDKFIPELRDLVGRVGELIDLFVSADSLLVRTLDDPLSRHALGLTVPETPVESATADE